MKTITTTAAWLALAAVASAGCTSSTTTGATMYQSRNDLVPVTVVNGLHQPACNLWMAPIDASDWGLDWLGGADTLPSGATRQFRMPPGRWDVRTAGCNGTDINGMESILVDGSHTAFVLGTPPAPETAPATATAPTVMADPAMAAPSATATPVSP